MNPVFLKAMTGRGPCVCTAPRFPNSCCVCRVRMMCLRDLLYLSSTVTMRTPPLCRLYPEKRQSSGTRPCAGSSASQTSANGTERSASTATGTLRYRRWGTPGGAGAVVRRLSSVFPSQGELRPFLSDPELVGAGDGSSHVSVVVSGPDGYRTLPSRGTHTTDPPGRVYR